MAYTTGTAAHYKDLLSIMVTFASANGWTVLTQTTEEVYLRGKGAEGLDEIYCGVRTFENSTTGYYNWQLYGSVFWKSNLPITAQPLRSNYDWNTHAYFWNQPIPYWMVATPRRIILVAKVGTTYQHVHLGFIDPVGTAAQYPYPLFIGGCGANETVAYSTTDQSAYWAGYQACCGRLYLPGGTWGRVNQYNADGGTAYSAYVDDDHIERPDCIICGLYDSNRAITMTAPDGSYLLEPLFIRDRKRHGVYGQLNGIFRVTGYQNASENIITVAGVNYMVFQDTYRSGYGDFCAMRMN